MTLLSIVSTLYKSERYIPEFIQRCTATASKISADFEIILVDDGSPDNSLALAKSLIPTCESLRIIELSRNFGHHAAILAGLKESRGNKVFLIDSDLEEAPELLLSFHTEMLNDPDIDVVFGYHTRNGQPVLRRLTGGLFWRALSLASKLDIQENLANVRLMKRTYVDALLSMPDQSIFLGGMFAWPGFRQKAIRIIRDSRKETTYTWQARARLASLAAISFSKTPLIIAFGLGCLITLVAFVVGTYVLLNRLVQQHAIMDGWTSLMLSIWFLGGLIMGSVGILGLYIAQIFDQVRERPRYIVRSRHQRL